MPNPYHDETGKFCSADEMQAAVRRLAGDGKFQEAFVLSQELAAIGQHNLREVEEQLAAFQGESSTSTTRKQPVAARAGVTRGRRAPAGPRGYTTGSRQTSAASQAAREGRPLAPTPLSNPAAVAPETKVEATAIPTAGPFEPQTPRSQILARLRQLSQEEALNLVRESSSARVAIAYADVYGWPVESEGFESLVLSDSALNSARMHLIAHRVQTPGAMNRIVNDRTASAETLTALAANPRLNPHLAVRLIGRAEDHPQAYAQIRQLLLNNPGSAHYLHRHLPDQPQLAEDSASPARLEDLNARIRGAQRELNILTADGTKAPLGANRARATHLSQQVAAARAALIAGDPEARAILTESAARGNAQAQAALAAARNYATQRRDLAILKAAKDLA